MIKRSRFPRIFFGWWMVLALSLLHLWGRGFHMYGFSVLFKPISSELGFSRAMTSVPASIGRFGGGFEAPVVGWLTDKFGPKWIMTCGIIVFGLGLILMNFIHSLWSFYVVWGILVGMGVNIAFGVAAEKAVANWFVRKRGIAFSLRLVLAGLLMLPLIAWLVETQGWRMTCVVGGVVIIIVGLPMVWFFVKQYRPEYYGLLPDGASPQEETVDTDQMVEKGVQYASEFQEVEYTLRQAMRTPAYWFLIAAQASSGITHGALIVHFVPFLTDMGMESTQAAATVALAGLASIASRFIAGFLADKVPRNYLRFLFGGAILMQAAGITIFLLNQSLTMTYPFLILYWFGQGTSLVLMPTTGARYFGRKAFGSIRGSSLMFTVPLGVLSPIFAGWVYDTTGNYITAFITFAVALGLAAFLVFQARPPRPPAQITGIHEIV